MRNSITRTRHVIFPRPISFRYYIQRKRRIKPITLSATVTWIKKKAASGTWVTKKEAVI